MSWINRKQKAVISSARLFDLNQSNNLGSISIDNNTLSTLKPNEKFLVAEIFSAPDLGYGNHTNPYALTAQVPFITIRTILSGNTYYNQSLKLQKANLQTKTNLVYSKVEKDSPQTKIITAINGATAVPDLITRLIMRVTQ